MSRLLLPCLVALATAIGCGGEPLDEDRQAQSTFCMSYDIEIDDSRGSDVTDSESGATFHFGLRFVDVSRKEAKDAHCRVRGNINTHFAHNKTLDVTIALARTSRCANTLDIQQTRVREPVPGGYDRLFPEEGSVTFRLEPLERLVITPLVKCLESEGSLDYRVPDLAYTVTYKDPNQSTSTGGTTSGATDNGDYCQFHSWCDSKCCKVPEGEKWIDAVCTPIDQCQLSEGQTCMINEACQSGCCTGKGTWISPKRCRPAADCG